MKPRGLGLVVSPVFFAQYLMSPELEWPWQVRETRGYDWGKLTQPRVGLMNREGSREHGENGERQLRSLSKPSPVSHFFLLEIKIQCFPPKLQNLEVPEVIVSFSLL